MTASAPGNARLTRPDGSPIRALVVDDEVYLSGLLRMAMANEGWDARTASNGQEALNVVRELEPDLLAIDAVGDAHAADPSRDWRLNVPEEPIVVTGDENRIRQVIANLLRNARTHTPAGTVVTTSLAKDGAFARIEVRSEPGETVFAVLLPLS